MNKENVLESIRKLGHRHGATVVLDDNSENGTRTAQQALESARHSAEARELGKQMGFYMGFEILIAGRDPYLSSADAMRQMLEKLQQGFEEGLRERNPGRELPDLDPAMRDAARRARNEASPRDMRPASSSGRRKRKKKGRQN